MSVANVQYAIRFFVRKLLILGEKEKEVTR